MMNSLKIYLRILLMSLILSLLPCLLTFIVFGRRGIFVGFVLVIAGLILAALIAEKGICRGYYATHRIPKGLLRTLEAIARQKKLKKIPNIFMIPDSMPSLWVAKSFSARGSILISQGLLALMKEDELQELISQAIEKLEEQGTVFKSTCLILTLGFQKLAPQAWLRLFFQEQILNKNNAEKLGPLSALIFVTMYPWLQLFHKLGKPSDLSLKSILQRAGNSFALQKVSRLISI